MHPVLNTSRHPQRAADQQNAEHLAAHNHNDNVHLHKYLPHNISSIFGSPLSTDDNDDFVPSPWLLEAIEDIATKTVPTPALPPFRFTDNPADAAYNSDLLCAYNYNLTKLLEDNQHTSLVFRS